MIKLKKKNPSLQITVNDEDYWTSLWLLFLDGSTWALLSKEFV